MTASPTAYLRATCGTVLGPPDGRWTGDADPTERRVLDLAPPPVLDVGCGPGRHTVALAERGVPALGIDVTTNAVLLARARGAAVLERSVFDRIPGAGRWASALLLDGNLGIGGRPAELLARVASLLRAGGIILTEVEPPGARPEHRRVRLEVDRWAGPWFDWAPVSADELDEPAARAGLRVGARWESEGRWFARLDTP